MHTQILFRLLSSVSNLPKWFSMENRWEQENVWERKRWFSAIIFPLCSFGVVQLCVCVWVCFSDHCVSLVTKFIDFDERAGIWKKNYRKRRRREKLNEVTALREWKNRNTHTHQTLYWKKNPPQNERKRAEKCSWVASIDFRSVAIIIFLHENLAYNIVPYYIYYVLLHEHKKKMRDRSQWQIKKKRGRRWSKIEAKPSERARSRPNRIWNN